MKSNLDAAQRLVGDDGKPAEATLQSKDWKITTHDKAEHMGKVIEHQRTYALQLRAADRVLGDLLTVLKNAAKTAERLQAYDSFPAVLEHRLEKEQSELGAVIKRHEREIAALEIELERAKRIA